VQEAWRARHADAEVVVKRDRDRQQIQIESI